MAKLYLIVSRYLTVFLVCGTISVYAQKSVVGKVTSADDKSGIPGVNILEKGTTNGTVSDGEGNYKITVGDNATLIFSFIGYKSQEITVGAQTTMDIAMETDVTSLAEVIVLGYGQQEKKDITGSVIALGTRDLNRGIVSSPQDMLVGKVAGVTISTNDGAPGANATIRIRGDGSAVGSRDPLIVIDGFPVDNYNTSGVSNPLSTINPNDIETYTVLKDASATAIYGLRASNGVIIITTKKGKEGKPVISYNVNVSASQPAKYLDVLTGDEYRAMVQGQLAAGQSGLTAKFAQRLGTANTNWQKEVYRTAITHDHNLNVAGSVRNIPYRVSYGYTDNQGILKSTAFNRNSLNVNLTPTFLDGDLQVTGTFKGSYTQQNFGNTGAIGSAVGYDPTQVVRNGTSDSRWGGYYTWVGTADTLANGAMNPVGNPITIAPGNPVSLVEQTDNRSKVYRGLGSLKLDYRLRFFPAIKVTLNAGFDYSKSDGHNNAPLNAAWTFLNGGGQLINYTGNNKSRLLDLYVDYTKQMGQHKFDVTLGHSYQSFERYGSNFARNRAPAPNTNYTDYSVAGDGVTPVPRQYIPNLNYLLSFFGRINYSYADKYLLTASFRDDASSRFSKAKSNQWVLFPSAAIGWRVSKESFMTAVKAISDLKIRASYGITGNQDVANTAGSYPYLPLYVQSNQQAQYQFGSTFINTQRPSPYDADLKWETTTQADVGLDLGLLDNKFGLTVDVYQKKTKNLLNTIPVAAGSNFSNYLTTNVGTLENKGLEITLRTVLAKTDNLEWNFGINYTAYQNKVTRLLKTDDPSYAGIFVGGISGGVGTTIQNIQVGYPINSFLVFEQVYNAQGRPIEGVYTDISGDGGAVTANNLNKIRYHSPAAKQLVGINTRVNYKKWDLYASGRVSLGNYVYNNNLSSRAFYSGILNQAGYFNNIPSAINDTKFVNPQYYSNYYIEDASFFKMDNISLGYSFDHLIAEKLKGRISFTVQNAFIVTKYKGLDPEVNGSPAPNIPLSTGIDNNLYPRPRVFLVGLNLSF